MLHFKTCLLMMRPSDALQESDMKFATVVLDGLKLDVFGLCRQNYEKLPPQRNFRCAERLVPDWRMERTYAGLRTGRFQDVDATRSSFVGFALPVGASQIG